MRLYDYELSGNCYKVRFLLHALGIAYERRAINFFPGREHKSDQFLSEVNPLGQIPVLEDDGFLLRDAQAILVYLAEKFGAFLPAGGAARAETLSWLFWQMGSAPFLGGGFGHFYAYAPEKIRYAIDRYAMEVKRQMDVLDRQLANNRYVAGDEYTIADMAAQLQRLSH